MCKPKKEVEKIISFIIVSKREKYLELSLKIAIKTGTLKITKYC
jgi:hypothetical protein